AKTKRNIGDAAAHFRVWQVGFYPTRGIDVINGVVVVLLHAGSNGEDIGIKDNVFRSKTDFVSQDSVGAFTNPNLVLIRGSLSLFVEGHHDSRCAVFQD